MWFPGYYTILKAPLDRLLLTPPPLQGKVRDSELMFFFTRIFCHNEYWYEKLKYQGTNEVQVIGIA